MRDLTLQGKVGSELTMDSREIAEITGKEHRKVCRDIEEYLGRLEGGVAKFGHTYRSEQNGQEYPCFKLPYRETMILVSGYSVELRAAVIDRWLELERRNKLALVELPDFTNPVAAARAWADEAEKRQLAEKQIVEQAPKVAYADEISNSEGGIPLSDFAHVLASKGWEIGRTRLFRLLIASGVLFESFIPALKKKVSRPYQNQIEAGRFLVHEVAVNPMNALYPQVLITPKGQKFVIDHLVEWEVKRLVRENGNKEVVA